MAVFCVVQNEARYGAAKTIHSQFSVLELRVSSEQAYELVLKAAFTSYQHLQCSICNTADSSNCGSVNCVIVRANVK
jgi:hypothetical protein